MPFSPFLFKIVMMILVSAIRQENEVKCINIAKAEVQLSLFTDDIILGKSWGVYQKDLLELINDFSSNTRYMANIKYQQALRK